MSAWARVSKALEAEGALFETDSQLPSVASLVAGEPVRGSWWGHPKGREIFAVLERLEHFDDALCVKLFSGKRTHLHRRHWGALFTIATSGSAWQKGGLTGAARRLLRKVEGEGRLRIDRIPRSRTDPKERRRAANELELRLLVHGESLHTDSGAHAKQLTSWRRVIEELEYGDAFPEETEARAELETLVSGWDERYRRRATVPWRRKS